MNFWIDITKKFIQTQNNEIKFPVKSKFQTSCTRALFRHILVQSIVVRVHENFRWKELVIFKSRITRFIILIKRFKLENFWQNKALKRKTNYIWLSIFNMIGKNFMSDYYKSPETFTANICMSPYTKNLSACFN